MSGLAEILDENARLREQMALLQAELSETKSELSKQQAMTDVATARVHELEQSLGLILRSQTEPASQRYIQSEQAMLPFATADVLAPPRPPQPEDTEDPGEDANTPTKRRGKPKRRKRASLDHLNSRKVVCTASHEACAKCGEALVVIGQTESFRVNWQPGYFFVEDVVRDKCACPACPDQGVLTVPGPYALDRALCGNALLARVAVDKYADHLPLHRQAKRMGREGFDVATNTLAGWVKATGELLSPIAKAVRSELLTSSFLQGDDTGMPVQDAGNGRLRKGRLWAFTDQQQVFYAFTPTKEGVEPVGLLEGFAGDLLVVDGGSEFNEVVRKQDLIRGGCWSHLRKRFFEARHAHPAEAHIALRTIRDLFLIERHLWGRPPDAIREHRQQVTKPIVEGFFSWSSGLSAVARPESLLGKALHYAIRRKDTLTAHLEHGEMPMHNNLSELMLRQAVVGRKNWLFARSEGGAEVAATLYTLVGSCMLQGIDPHDYFVDVLGRVQDNTAKQLTPRVWAQSHP